MYFQASRATVKKEAAGVVPLFIRFSGTSVAYSIVLLKSDTLTLLPRLGVSPSCC